MSYFDGQRISESDFHARSAELKNEIGDLETYLDSLSCGICGDAGFNFEFDKTTREYIARSCSCRDARMDFTDTHDWATTEILHGDQLLDTELFCRRCDAHGSEVIENPCDEVSDVAELFPAEAHAARMKTLMAKLDAACAKALADPPVYTVKWAPIIERPRREEPKGVRCICERNDLALQAFRAAEYNEHRPADAPAWDVPLWIVEAAAEIQESCPATLHFPSLLDAAMTTSIDPTVIEWSDPHDQEAIKMRIALDSYLAEQALAAARPIQEQDWQVTEDRAAHRERLADEKRRELINLIRSQGGVPNSPQITAWVKSKIAEKQGDRLRGYCAAIYQLERRSSGHTVPSVSNQPRKGELA